MAPILVGLRATGGLVGIWIAAVEALRAAFALAPCACLAVGRSAREVAVGAEIVYNPGWGWGWGWDWGWGWIPEFN